MQTWPRRRFVRHAATVASAAVVAPAVLVACRDDAGQGNGNGNGTTTGTPQQTGRPTGAPNAFRLSSRHVRNPCNACLSHNRNRYYASAEAAEADRPHEGCNCEVRGQVIPDQDASTFFASGRTVHDERAS